MKTTSRLPGLCLSLLVAEAILGAEGRFVQLTGWGGGKPEEIVPPAAEAGFDEIIVGNPDPQYLGQLVALGRKHKIGIYSSIQLGDLRDWKKRRPDVNPPLQKMNADENAALERIRADKTKGKSGYQYGGEPVHGIEVLQTPLLCFHDPQVRTFFEEQIRDRLRVPGLRGIAMDYFGYQNYRCCRCPASMEAFEAWHKQHADLPSDVALDRFALDTLVEFVNGLARYARSVRADAKVACHIYPVFLSEPLYGNRLDVDFCGQTAAWYFDPLWSYEKIRSYTRVICGQEKKHFARPEGVAMIGVYTRPALYPVKSPERLTGELQAILDGGGDRVQVCSLNDVLKDPATREVFQRFFRRDAAAGPTGEPPAAPPARKQNVIVYKEPGRYGGWPANHGIWAWGNEIVVGFTAAWYKPVKEGHAVDRSKPFEKWQARSLDGGATWAIEKPACFDRTSGTRQPTALPGPVDFTHPDFALAMEFASIHVGPSSFYVSSDRCRTWRGPFAFSAEGVDKIATRTDYLVLSKHDCLMFGSCAKSNNREGRPFCARTQDGGVTWRLLSRIGPEPEGYAIMPSSVRLAGGALLTTIRCLARGRPASIDAYRSADGGRQWEFLGAAAPNIGGGNPPSLVLLRDGRLCLTYGYRARPWGVRARISRDEGRTWGPEIVLRDDALNGDLGYPRSVQRPDGKMLTVYYFNGPKDEDRAIEATIWEP